MIDIHTHILPGIDDGSQSVEETLEILDEMEKTGVNKVVATPHYYCEKSTIDDFLKNRQVAYEKIIDKKPENIDIILGAEVLLEYNLHKLDLKKLAIEGTDYILIEMPYGKWDPWVFDELFKISAKHGLEIILAHIDRYLVFIKKEHMRTLMKMNIKFQVNVDYLGGIFKKSGAMQYIKDGVADFIGSDCHNMTTRPPCFAKAYKKIKSKCGKETVDNFMENARKMLQNKSL